MTTRAQSIDSKRYDSSFRMRWKMLRASDTCSCFVRYSTTSYMPALRSYAHSAAWQTEPGSCPSEARLGSSSARLELRSPEPRSKVSLLQLASNNYQYQLSEQTLVAKTGNGQMPLSLQESHSLFHKVVPCHCVALLNTTHTTRTDIRMQKSPITTTHTTMTQ
jgi:hypothetical protein